MKGLKKGEIDMNGKMLWEIGMWDEKGLGELVWKDKEDLK